ncbi:GNAT family N-acetyltransferase [Piscirickettsia litoralis]|uniref:N-acetyltransferase domain-containing protein n=1 Tax=Piscirickettsia litoralis TaxID=1891921 RepID=A0ABX3A0B3_9GAMM|nr:GNAT family N-acetyltransferase [Piscirickettsia litoralis]ODN42297.1 hypothetical protein BGC07_04315 [Piscirickettsia litoralis]
MRVRLRKITSHDDVAMAQIIRGVLTEFGANRPGFAWQDPEIDYLSCAYDKQGAAYYVIEDDKKIMGGGGLMALAGVAGICELQKMYLLPASRGLGLGMKLIDKLIDTATKFGYQACYLETLLCMEGANHLYQKTGFKRLDQSLGDTGHSSCDAFYVKKLSSAISTIDK